MVPESSTTTDSAAPSTDASSTGTAADAEDTSSTLVNVLVGGIAGIVLGFVPFSPVLGGAITGYLEESTPREAVKAGAMAGVVMLVPFAFFGLFVAAFLLGFGDAPLALGIFGFFAFVFAGFYTVGLSALGGYIGDYLRDEL